MKKLPKALSKQISSLVSKGDVAVEQGDLDAADQSYLEAFRLLPEPKLMQEGGVEIGVARADVKFKRGEFDKVAVMLGNLMEQHKAGWLDGIIGNPYIHLRIGQAHLELGNTDRAKDELARAFMGGGTKIFEGEDRKYLAFIMRFLDVGN